MPTPLKLNGYIGQPEGMEALITEFSDLKKVDEWLAANPDGNEIEINSGGGSARIGFSMFDTLKESGRDFTVKVLGECGSIATIFLFLAPVEKRRAYKNSEIFVHNPYWRPQSPEAIEADDAESLAKSLRQEEERILNFYVENTKQEKSKIQKLMKKQTALTTDEAKELGFIGEIIGEEIKNQKKFPILAFVDREKKALTDTDKSWIGKKIAGIDKRIDDLLKSFLPKKENMTAKLKDGKEVFVESEDGDWTGKKIFEADKTTPVKAGSYPLEDGRVLVVDENGVITEVKAAENKPNPMQAEMDKLKKDLKEVSAKLAAKEAEKKDEKIAELKGELLEIKNHYEKNFGKIPAKAKQGFKGGDEGEQKSDAQLLKEYRESKNKK